MLKWSSVDDILLAAYCDRKAADLDYNEAVSTDAYTALLDSYEYLAADNGNMRLANRRTQRALLLASAIGGLGWIMLWVSLWLLVKVWK